MLPLVVRAVDDPAALALAVGLFAPAPLVADDRVMICGNPEMLVDLKAGLIGQGFTEGSSGEPGAFVIEKAFAER